MNLIRRMNYHNQNQSQIEKLMKNAMKVEFNEWESSSERNYFVSFSIWEEFWIWDILKNSFRRKENEYKKEKSNKWNENIKKMKISFEGKKNSPLRIFSFTRFSSFLILYLLKESSAPSFSFLSFLRKPENFVIPFSK